MKEIGSKIKEFRLLAGYTQKTLADALHITDKAVSKWERGICLPDVTLLPKLALLLDVDADGLIAKNTKENECAGLIDICNCDFSQVIYDKPLAYYLLSHYLLLGITEIYVLSTNENTAYLKSEAFQTLGFRFHFDAPKNRNTMILNRPWFLFGSNLTQHFQGAILSGRSLVLVPENQAPVFFFARESDSYFQDKKRFVKSVASRTLGRGMICFDMSEPEKALDVAAFVKAYQNNTGLLIGSLEEIAYRKGILSLEMLQKMISKVPYGRLLQRVAGKP